MTADIELLPLPEIERWRLTGDYAYPAEVDPEGEAVDYDAHVAAMQSYARANMAPLIAEIERLRAVRDSFQRVGIAAQARAERLEEALRRQRDWWLASKGEAVSNAPGGLTRIDPGFIALCDAHVQQIDLALRDHDQEGSL